MGLLGPYIYMSPDLTEKVGQFSGPYMYGYLFFKKKLISGTLGPSGAHMYFSWSY